MEPEISSDYKYEWPRAFRGSLAAHPEGIKWVRAGILL